MKTEIIEINPERTSLIDIRIAARKIQEGGLVAFPTETVYGLGADALNPKAVAKIFEAKKRPLEDPLIVHIAQKEDLFTLVENIPDITQRLTDELWPGPLTLVLRKSRKIPDIVTAGLGTVAVRIPANRIALALIEFSQSLIAAPSANLFGRSSPICAQHVLDDLDGRIDIIIDGGKTIVGVESTVLDLTQNPPCVLRPGGVSMERLKEIVPEVEIYKQKKILSPGMYRRHYSPMAKVILVEGDDKIRIEKVKKLASCFSFERYCVGILVKEQNRDKYDGFNVRLLGPENDLAACAANLFSVLREFDKEAIDIIIAESVEEEGLGLAIMDRLRKAAGVVL